MNQELKGWELGDDEVHSRAERFQENVAKVVLVEVADEMKAMQG